jgi:nucleoside-diphosphate-sugar epimerase
VSGPIAILGANGFIGSRAVEMLHLSGNAEVRPIVRRPQALARVSRFALDGRVADGFDKFALIRALRGCETVVHAIAGDARTILGTVEPLYAAASMAGLRRLIYISSASVHGQSPAPGTDETSPLSDRQPIPYNNAKVQAERRLGRLRRTGSVEVIILRPGIVFGPRSFWTASFADELLAGTAYLVGGGLGICNSAYVDNLVHAIELSAASPAGDGNAYLIGDREEITWADLCHPIANALGIDFAAVAKPENWCAPRYMPFRTNLSKASRLIAKKLPHPMRAGLKAAYAAWRGSRMLISNAPGPPIEVSQERALLHRCSYKLPSTKAEIELGYRPIVAFEEGCRRSVAWLSFAGYPVRSTQGRSERRFAPRASAEAESTGTPELDYDL